MFKKSLLFLIPLLLFFVAWFIVKEDSFSVLDSKNHYFSTFTDANIDGGQSNIIAINKDAVSRAITFELEEGFISPYAGISFTAKEKAWDLSSYNQVEIDLALKNTKNLEMTIGTYQDGVTKENDGLTYRHNGIEVPISDNLTSYVLPFNEMKIEQWWLERFKLRSSELGEANWSKTESVSLVAKIRLDNQKEQLLTVNSIVFSKSLKTFYQIAGVLMVLWYIAVLFYLRFGTNKKEALVIKYQQTEIEPVTKNNDNQILEYIATKYTNPDLGLSQISEALKVSEKQISAHIKKEFNLGFKEYLNGIRITEAKRLLQISDKNVSEIAYQVGFNSPNHFNRIFKAAEGFTPTDFRKTS